ncbi:hypothetical protein [Streptomyces sp. RFCAC02]|uniref:hypothetical protein n=1 Tax=Streptomyces sp. RFCAC02 TaxID=2499143 RepID=UPI001021C52A|nr:hypothetical protein [Streptomyces sp. RFCAC02]
MSEVTFGREDIEARLGADGGTSPWTLMEDFSDEIDAESMAETAAVYRRAAGEADTIGDLARTASQVAEDSSEWNGAALADGEGRAGETTRDLQDDGTYMGEVSTLLSQAMDIAVETDDAIHGMVDYAEDDANMEYVLKREVGIAEGEWENWQQFLSYIDPYDPSKGHIVTYDYQQIGEILGLDPQRPAYLAEAIKKHHVKQVAEHATEVATAITDTIEGYRAALTRYGADLGDLGYDLTGGPLQLWSSEEMAQWAVDHINAADPSDDAAMRPYLETLQSLTTAAQNGRKLTEQERDYLDYFFNNLDQGRLRDFTLAAAGRTPVDPGSSNWGSITGTEDSTAQILADAFTVMYDPERGGFDPEQHGLPAEVSGMLHPRYNQYGNRVDPGAEDAADYISDYGQTASFLALASDPPGDSMARLMADSALYTQNLSSTHPEYRTSPNGGSDILLETAARNSDAAAGMLADKEFTNELFDQQWDVSKGAAALVTAGTTVPAGQSEGAYTDALGNVRDVALNDWAAVQHGRGEVGADRELDHSDLEKAVGALLPDSEAAPPF